MRGGRDRVGTKCKRGVNQAQRGRGLGASPLDRERGRGTYATSLLPLLHLSPPRYSYVSVLCHALLRGTLLGVEELVCALQNQAQSQLVNKLLPLPLKTVVLSSPL
jgi:hypothetical protein